MAAGAELGSLCLLHPSVELPGSILPLAICWFGSSHASCALPPCPFLAGRYVGTTATGGVLAFVHGAPEPATLFQLATNDVSLQCRAPECVRSMILIRHCALWGPGRRQQRQQAGGLFM